MATAETVLKQQLVKKRGFMKSHVTIFGKYLSDWRSEQGIQLLKFKLEKFNAIWDEFQDIQCKLLEVEDETVIIKESQAFEKIFFATAEKATEIIRRYEAENATAANRDHSAPWEAKAVQLPQIELMKFSGNLSDWVSFSSVFQTLITDNSDLSNVKKLCYLKGCLTGSPANLIAPLALTDENFLVAWESLKARYQNKTLTSMQLVTQLFNIQKIERVSAQLLRCLCDDVQRTVSALKALDHPVQHWDLLLVHLICSKLDSQTRQAWEFNVKLDSLPTYKDLLAFLLQRCNSLDRMELSNANKKGVEFKLAQSASSPKKVSKSFSHALVTTVEKCHLCGKASHLLFQCEKFKSMSVQARFDYVKSINACFNCLKKGHSVQKCRSSCCKLCSNKHNTFLHFENVKNHDEGSNVTNDANLKSEKTLVSQNLISQLTNVSLQNQYQQVLLSTAVVKVQGLDGGWHSARCLLDMASQSNIMTFNLSKRLGLEETSLEVDIVGIGSQLTQSVVNVTCPLASKISKKHFNQKLCFFVLPNITGQVPAVKVSTSHLEIPPEITLADPDFHTPGAIDILLGAEVFWESLQPGVVKLGPGLPTLRNTSFGWLCVGTLPNEAGPHSSTLCNLCTAPSLHDSIQKFWEVETIPTGSKAEIDFTPEEKVCEEIFQKQVTRDVDGRFTVALPFRDEGETLGESKNIAVRKFYSLETRLSRDPLALQEYVKFFKDYEDSGHMSALTQPVLGNKSYFVPHFEVLRETSDSTPLRVVFNASSPTSNAKSLNDLLLSGPKTQSDLRQILIRFRSHPYVVVGDIKQFFRQINVTSKQRSFQQICWRASKNLPIRFFQLNTVTYGLKSSPYLAGRCLRQLFHLEASDFPLISDEWENFYVDDYLGGHHDEDEAIRIRQQLSKLLMRGGFHICKWKSNSSKILASIPSEEKSKSSILNFEKECVSSALGMQWSMNSDTLAFSFKDHPPALTKRAIFSQIGQLFDPLGLLGPKVCTAKLIMQKLWALQISWDHPVPAEILRQWTMFITDLKHLQQLVVPRCLSKTKPVIAFELHFFADASMVAYGACCYLVTRYVDASASSALVTARHKVAPLKLPQTRTLPQLELCAAFLAIKLFQFVVEALTITIDSTFFWTDSGIVLSWLANPKPQLPVFVRNRVAAILTSTQIKQWGHVPSSQNPADLLSRGASVQSLIELNLWWNGPEWLLEQPSSWPVLNNQTSIQIKTIAVVACSHLSSFQINLLHKYSDFRKLIGVIAYCQRFIAALKSRAKPPVGPLSLRETNAARDWIYKMVQKQAFPHELQALTLGKVIAKSSPLFKLSPFLDAEGLIRVGGRIHLADLTFSQKHPIVLPAKHHITRLVIEREHKQNFHANLLMLIGILRQSVWILQIRRAVRSVISKCVHCFKRHPLGASQMMSNLPKDRVIVNHPFTTTGLDYCGPINIKSGTRRNASILKTYIAVFVCFTTRAVHLEIVEDLTTEAFLRALHRFVARRGCPSVIWSDNATTFKGAANQLIEDAQLMQSQTLKPSINEFCVNHNITWKWICPNSPHQGGLWEAAVKQFKSCFKRVIGLNPLTFLQMHTLVTQIEACLNSRPLISLSEDLSDLTALTPAHFLIGRSLKSISQPLLDHYDQNLLSNWQKILHFRDRFWKLWSVQYLNSLQVRSKWNKQEPNIKIGDLALLIETRTQPLTWKLGRVSAVFPDEQGLVRSVEILTKHGKFTRSIQKLAPLPSN